MSPPTLPPTDQPRPRLRVPAGACDCHCHIFGPPDRFPYAEGRRYTPPDATFEDYSALLDHLGIERTVIVHPSPYGNDHRCTLDAMARFGKRARGVAIIDPMTSDAELEALTAAGMRGTRVGLIHRYGPAFDTLEEMANRVKAFGWHIEFAIDVATLPEVEEQIRALPVPIVVDHCGWSDPSAGVDEPGFQILLAMVREGRCWVKLSAPYYTSREGPPHYGDLRPRIEALVAANPRRLLWASNWPHPTTDATPKDVELLDVLSHWIPDDATRQIILADNPAALYGFA